MSRYILQMLFVTLLRYIEQCIKCLENNSRKGEIHVSKIKKKLKCIGYGKVVKYIKFLNKNASQPVLTFYN